MDVVTAIEGRDDVFRCTEIRQRAEEEETAELIQEFQRPCGVASAMRRAELAWRRELAGQSVADLMAAAPPGRPTATGAATPGRAADRTPAQGADRTRQDEPPAARLPPPRTPVRRIWMSDVSVSSDRPAVGRESKTEPGDSPPPWSWP